MLHHRNSHNASLSKTGFFGRGNKTVSRDPQYAENAFLSDFTELKIITSNKMSNPIILSFDERFIMNYEKINLEEVNQFANAIENLKFCRAENEIGIKMLKGTIKCKFNVGDLSYDKEITHELKINGKGRIALMTLSPINDGPALLVATHYLKNGFHEKSKSKIFYSSLDFNTLKAEKNVVKFNC